MFSCILCNENEVMCFSGYFCGSVFVFMVFILFSSSYIYYHLTRDNYLFLACSKHVRNKPFVRNETTVPITLDSDTVHSIDRTQRENFNKTQAHSSLK